MLNISDYDMKFSLSNQKPVTFNHNRYGNGTFFNEIKYYGDAYGAPSNFNRLCLPDNRYRLLPKGAVLIYLPKKAGEFPTVLFLVRL